MSSVDSFNTQLKLYFLNRREEAKDIAPLFDSIEYSLFNGGKRFRPRLCYAVASSLGLSEQQIAPFAMAVECIHTYSLIHDDLPCMDNDNERRGMATNHVEFGEDLALLAGDALLTEAFMILAEFYPSEAGKLTRLVAEASGFLGMVRGQSLDLGHGKETDSLSELIHLHQLKTGRLIALCFEGPATLAGKNSAGIRELGLMLGLAFQVKDDLLDAHEQDQVNFVSFLGKAGTEKYLESLTEKIERDTAEYFSKNSAVQELIEFNLKRET